MFKQPQINRFEPTPITLITRVQPGNVTSEQYQSLRTHLNFVTTQRPWHSLTVTSAMVGEGKSTVSANLAITYADAGERVLLIDTNLRRATVHQTFKLNNQTGLSTYLADPTVPLSRLVQLAQPNLTVLPSGPCPSRPTALVTGKVMQQLLASVSQDYDRVILDAAPVLPVTDGLVLASWTETTLLVVRHALSQKQPLQQAVAALQVARANLTGLVLNDVQDGKTTVYTGYQPQR